MECVSKIHEQTNQRIYDRNIPSQVLQPYLDVRPVMTKYAYFPIVDGRADVYVPLQKLPKYSTTAVFNPGNRAAPWSGYNANLESELRNQVFALQKCSQAVYIPSSASDLYTYSYTPNSAAPINTHALLFEKPKFNSFNPNVNAARIGGNVFMNATRCQLKEL
jgi:hypothetical protein